MPKFLKSTLVCLIAVAGCAAPDDVTANQEALRARVSPLAISFELTTRDEFPHGVAGDRRLVFITQPLDGTVVALDRFNGREVAVLPGPDAPYILPFVARIPYPGRLVVLDPGGFPDPSGTMFPTARLIEYDYTYTRRWRGARLDATIVRTISLASVPTVFTEDFTALADGSYIVSEAGIGALWFVDQSGAVLPGIVPRSPAPSDAIAELAGCAFPEGVEVGGIPFQFAGNFAPGVGSLASDDTYLYFGNTCRGGLQRVPLEVFHDERPPFARAEDIELLSPPPGDVLVDALKGLAVDIYRNPDVLYAADAFQLRVVRIDLTTGAREVVATDAQLFNFPVATTFLPPVFGFSPLVVVSDQEHRWTAINTAIDEDLFQPFIVAKVIPFRHPHRP